MSADETEVVIAGHICLDIIPELPEGLERIEEAFTPGRLTALGPAAVSTGGAVANTGLALHRLGVPARLVGKVGDDLFGRAILDYLRRRGPRLADDMTVAPGEASSYSIVISAPRIDRLFLHCSGANDTFGADDVPPRALQGARAFHFGYPTAMRRMRSRRGETESLFRAAKNLGLTTSLDTTVPDTASDAGRTDWADFLRRVLPHVDLFLPSIDELLVMLAPTHAGAGQPGGLVSGTMLADLAGRLLEFGAAVAVIKLGDQGVYLRTTADVSRLERMGRAAPGAADAWCGCELLAPAFEVDVAGTTGAGDCAVAGFLTGLLRGHSPAEVLGAAAAAGAASAEQPDATSGVPTWDDLRGRIAAGWKRRDVAIPLPGWTWNDDRTLAVGPNG